jgi:hypothetical protein
MIVSGEADPFHLSAGSPSTGQPTYFEKALMRRFRLFAGPRGRTLSGRLASSLFDSNFCDLYKALASLFLYSSSV